MLAYHFLVGFFVFFAATAAIEANGTQNITIPVTSPEIVYSPFLCNGTYASGSIAGGCVGAWELLPLSDELVASTSGPDPLTGNVIPQMFLDFRARAVYLKFSSSSNATANMTVSRPSGMAVSILLNSTIAGAGVVDLIESDLMSLAITFIPGNSSSSLNIEYIIITVGRYAESSSFLPSMTLPPSIPPLTFTPPASTSTTETSHPTVTHKPVNIKEIEGLSLVLGIGLGLSLITGLVFFFLRRRERNRVQKPAVDFIRW